MLIKFNTMPTNIWFTSDHHFGHGNIIEFCDRSFDSVEQMDDCLIECWNKRVKPNDMVYHLGDFTFGDEADAKHYFSRLNGHIRLLGNIWHHDKRWLMSGYTDMFVVSKDRVIDILPPMVALEVPQRYSDYPRAVTLCHYPLAKWDRRHYGGICLHGHCHGNYQLSRDDDLILDVGVDSAAKLLGEYRPFSLVEVFDCLGVVNGEIEAANETN